MSQKISFQNKTVSIEAMDLTFDQMGDMEKALTEQAIYAFTDNVNVAEGQRIVELGKKFGLVINPMPEDVEPETASTEETPEELYQVAGAAQ